MRQLRDRVGRMLNQHARGDFGPFGDQAARQMLRDRVESLTGGEWRARRTARTETAVTTNVAAADTLEVSGATSCRLFDGDDCHLGPGHDSGPLADGLEVPIVTAQSIPISHPNCVRQIVPV